MQVLMVNGSPHEQGCTYTALKEIAKELETQHIDSEIIQIGKQAIHGCIGCGTCRAGKGKCIFENDIVNTILEQARKADGFIFGSPVYFASANGSMVSLMDRLFYAGKDAFQYKPGACVVSARRAGTTATYDQLNKYLELSQMVMVPSPYWNMVHGNTPEEVQQDKEGLWIMRTLGQNMAWLLRVLKNAEEQQVAKPQELPVQKTNYIR